jgi:hypothetical protein
MEMEPIPLVLDSLPGDTLLKRIDTTEVLSAIDRLSAANQQNEREILLRSGIPPLCGERLALLVLLLPPDLCVCSFVFPPSCRIFFSPDPLLHH